MEINQGLSDKAKSDLLLVEEAKKGNEKAFASLMTRYRDSIYFMLLKMVNNPSDAEDLTIEALRKAFRNIDSYPPRYAFSTWLFMIATNNCIDFVRKKQSSPIPYDQANEALDNITSNIQSDLPDPEETLINDQKIATLRKIINQLKSPYREIIELRYYKEYSYEEIASELNMPIGTVKAQLFRAKTQLYNIYQNRQQVMPDSIFRYFPSLSADQRKKLSLLKSVYTYWNNMINLVSRKDMENFYIRHVLHSLSVAKIIAFLPGTRILDVGTGGGFPGIPLAILFPDSEFILLDSIGKKIKVASAVASALELKNVRLLCKRVEDEEDSYDFIVSRAVMDFRKLVNLVSKNILKHGKNCLENGTICLKGG